MIFRNIKVNTFENKEAVGCLKAFQLTLYSFRLRKSRLFISMDTGCDPGKPELKHSNLNVPQINFQIFFFQ
jgi:hypothetical protein